MKNKKRTSVLIVLLCFLLVFQISAAGMSSYDFDQSGKTDMCDVIYLANEYVKGATGSLYDLDKSGTFDVGDLLFLIRIIVTSPKESDLPTVSVGTAKASAGGMATVTLKIKNNPGLLGMVLKIGYDSSILTLTDSENGTALPALTMQKPGRYKNGCFFTWYGPDVGTISDGVILTLSFGVAPGTAAGSYPITVSYEDDAIQDGNKQPVSMTVENGFITVS